MKFASDSHFDCNISEQFNQTKKVNPVDCLYPYDLELLLQL